MPPPVPNRKLIALCVEDEPDLLGLMGDELAGAGFEVVRCADPDTALVEVHRHAHRLAVIVSDFSMPGGDAFSFRRAIPVELRNIPFVIVSGRVSREDAIAALELKISGFMAKPFDLGEFRTFVEKEARSRISSILEDDELRDSFVADARGLLDEMEQLALGLESRPDDQNALDRVFACAHTIKGSSGFFRPSVVHKFVHRFEDFLSPFKNGNEILDARKSHVMLRAIDRVRDLIDCLEDQRDPVETFEAMIAVFDANPLPFPAKVPGATVSAPSTSPKSEEIRIDARLLNDFSERSGEITVLRNLVDKILQSIDVKHPNDPQVTDLISLLTEMNKSVTAIQGQVENMKKVSLQHVLRPLHRALRDLGQSLGKDISLEINGADARVDQRLAEALGKCLIHLVRNSADHGIEATAKRLAAGKAAQGQILLSIFEGENAIEVTIKDDGAGVDTERVRAKAVERGLIDAETASRLAPAEVHRLIFHAGFSTADVVSDVSGRGVGMDMVKTTLDELGGRVDIDSVRGVGSTFTLTLPIPRAVHIVEALMVRQAKHTFAIPREDVDRVVDLQVSGMRGQLRSLGGQPHFIFQENVEAIVSIERLTGRPEPTAKLGHLVRLRSGSNHFLLAVDEVLGIEDIVVKALDSVCRKTRSFKGATFVDGGRVGLVLDVARCAEMIGLNQNLRSVADIPIDPEVYANFLTFDLGDGATYAVSQSDVHRVEVYAADPRQRAGSGWIMPYQDGVISVSDVTLRRDDGAKWPMLVLKSGNDLRGFLVGQIGDLMPLNAREDQSEIIRAEDRIITLIRPEQLAEKGASVVVRLGRAA